MKVGTGGSSPSPPTLARACIERTLTDDARQSVSALALLCERKADSMPRGPQNDLDRSARNFVVHHASVTNAARAYRPAR